MSNGTAFGGREVIGETNYTVLDGQIGALSGKWLDTRRIKTATLEIKNLAAGESIIVHCSNDPGGDPPADAVAGIAKQTIAGGANDQFVDITAPRSRWKRFEKTGSTSETTAHLAGWNI